MSKVLKYILSPNDSLKILRVLWKPCLWSSVVCALLAIYFILHVPVDVQQGSVYKIIYIHVPAAVLSMGFYFVLGICSILYLIFHLKIADVVAQCSAVLGCSLTMLALATGSIWGKPTWGTWWIWDARLTSEFILLMMYVAYILVRQTIKDPKKAGMVAGVIGLVGLLDLPIIHYSVKWWFTLHQGATLLKWGKPSMATEMLIPLLLSFLAFSLYSAFLLIRLMIGEIQKRKKLANRYRKALQSTNAVS